MCQQKLVHNSLFKTAMSITDWQLQKQMLALGLLFAQEGGFTENLQGMQSCRCSKDPLPAAP